MQFIDSHCHLDFSDFEHDLDSVISRAKHNGINGFVIPGVSSKSWDKQFELSQRYTNFYCAFGIHPWFLKNYIQSDLTQLDGLLQSRPVIAVGECGLDASIADMPLQQKVFMAQIELANIYNKPLIVHHRKSHHLIQQSFKQIKPRAGGVIHAFSGNIKEAEKYIELGFKLGVGGAITYERAKKTRATIKSIGLSHILLETDAPSMPLSGMQGRRNEPQNIHVIAKSVAQLLGCSVEEVAKKTTLNTKKLFNI